MSNPKNTEINGQHLGAIVEAILFAADRPLPAGEIARVITETELSPPIDEEDIVSVIDSLNEELEEQQRAFQILERGGGYTFATRAKYHTWLEKFQHQNARRKVSPSAVETLAIVAYRQPVTKPEIDHIRGVDSGYILRQLLEKQLIEVAGRYEGPGRALLYRTTSVFLQHFGINSVDELPRPREIEEILKDDDMAEHRQLMLELKSELDPVDRPHKEEFEEQENSPQMDQNTSAATDGNQEPGEREELPGEEANPGQKTTPAGQDASAQKETSSSRETGASAEQKKTGKA